MELFSVTLESRGGGAAEPPRAGDSACRVGSDIRLTPATKESGENKIPLLLLTLLTLGGLCYAHGVRRGQGRAVPGEDGAVSGEVRVAAVGLQHGVEAGVDSSGFSA